ncbi:uracil-DNA glycosylase [Algibacillus agarilyticus]|uniref:uracil-DNA glycosylase n=1 Tax=Algibacillus agarilyticus TaxID=2234133 RepID=UPI000DCFF74B|nr:uracil-DNA glycosylase [Algibacillus agarilyticus]
MTDWLDFIEQEKQQAYFKQLTAFVEGERLAGKTIYPAEQDVLNAFLLTPLKDVRVVILGQDPYHGAGQAHGLSFSIASDIKLPPSLKNIYKALALDDETFTPPTHGNLTAWAKQGVMLLNTVLTVEAGKAHSHAKKGWELFTDKAIELLNANNESIVFMLWGAHAQQKEKMIDGNKHCILKSVHPSPLSAHRGFFECQHFSKANAYLQKANKQTITWQL